MTPGLPLGLRLASADPKLKDPISDPFFFNGGNKPRREAITIPPAFCVTFACESSDSDPGGEIGSGQRLGLSILLLKYQEK